MPDTGPQTLIEAVRRFSDLDVCHEYMRNVKWPDGRIVCPKCGGAEIGTIASRRMLQCRAKECRKQFSCKVGTIFEDSPLGLDKWFVAVWCIANAKNGISSCELARALGIRQPSAWFMLHRIRLAMKAGGFEKMEGEVESDETFVGGKAANMHAHKRERVIIGRGAVGKAIVHGLLQRGAGDEPSQVRASVVYDTEAATLMPEVLLNVEPGSAVYTDSHSAYRNLVARFMHSVIDHSVEYVRGRVHTNGIENFWSLLKRTIKGSYVHVSPWQLARYVDEQVFRFNQRLKDDAERFREVMLSVVGKRLTYRQLAAVDGCGFMGLE